MVTSRRGRSLHGSSVKMPAALLLGICMRINSSEFLESTGPYVSGLRDQHLPVCPSGFTYILGCDDDMCSPGASDCLVVIRHTHQAVLSRYHHTIAVALVDATWSSISFLYSLSIDEITIRYEIRPGCSPLSVTLLAYMKSNLTLHFDVECRRSAHLHPS